MCSSCRCCCCCSSCGCGCSGSDSDSGVGGVFLPELSQFPVYVSYPAFFAGDTAIDGANQSIFGLSSNGTTLGLTRGSCGCRS